MGKSSLLNALSNRKGLAQVSKTPGRTRLLNCFALDDATVVDCPGYGFASVPAAQRESWRHMMEGYLRERRELRTTMVVVDGEIGPTKLDETMLDWLRAADLPFAVIATKHDKVPAARRERRRTEVASGCGLPRADVTWVSSAKGTGVDHLRGLVRGWLSVG